MNLRMCLCASTAVIASLSFTQSAAAEAAAAASAPPASAPPAAKGAAAGKEIDQVVVTARRVQENLQSVPVAVTALSATQIRELGIVDIESMARVTPGVVLSHIGFGSNTKFQIRGQTASSVGLGLPAVVTYFNDVPLPSLASSISTFDMDNLQVLKGPQGTLFGRNTTGGAVLAYSKRPSYEFGGYIDGKYTNYNGRYLEGAINIPLVEDKVALRLAAQSQRRDGYTKNMTGGGDLDDIDNASYRASLLLQPTSNFTNLTVFDYYTSDTTGIGNSVLQTLPGFTALAGAAPFFGSSTADFVCGTSPSCDGFLAAQRALANPREEWPTPGLPLYETVTTVGLSNTSTLALSDSVTLKNIFGWRRNHTVATIDGSGTEFPLVLSVNTQSIQAITDELQFSGHAFADKLNWIAGGFYSREHPPGTPGAALAFLSTLKPGVTAGSQSFTTTTSKAAYLSLGYDLSDMIHGLRANGGVRYTKDSSALCTIGNILGPNLDTGHLHEADCRANPTSFKGQSSSHAWTYTVGLDYQMTDDLFFYVTSRRGYRAGGLNLPQLAAPGPGVVNPLSQFQQFGPEFLTDVEVGAKTDWRVADWSGRFNIAAFRGVYESIQRSVVLPPNYDGDNNSADDPQAFSLNVNAGKAIIKGVEVGGVVRPTSDLSVNFAVAYLSPHYVNYSVPLAGITTSAPIFNDSAKWSTSASVRYALPIDPSHGQVVANADYYYIGKRIHGDLTYPSYSTTDLRLDWNGVENSRVDVGVYVQNVFNKLYFNTAQFTSVQTALFSVGYAPPRIYGVSLRYHFGAG